MGLQARTRQQHPSSYQMQSRLQHCSIKNGPLQQHLQLQAGNITTYAQIRSMVIEYYRATTSFTRLQAITSGNTNQGPAPMDIGATWYNKGKGKKGKHKGKGKHNKGKGYKLREQLRLQQLQRRKRQVQSTTGWTRKFSKDNKDTAKEKDTTTKEKAKDTTVTNKEEKEQTESRQQMFATDADNPDTWPNNAERRSTTATLEPSTPMTRQMTGAIRHTTTTTGTTRTRHRCTN